ncbi:GNAT family N-acetyltransferase [Candidatus Falkowbacteria bacterium]|nr:GNAT family N-acetyltransferase [Candidatus Falkowbacteria bacterium]
MIIRSFQKESDYQCVREMVYECWMRHYPSAEYGITRNDVHITYQVMSTSPRRYDPSQAISCNRFVGVSDLGQILGYVAVMEFTTTNYLQSLYVSNDFIDQGFGRRLLEHAFYTLNNKKSWSLGVVKYNKRAIHLYESFGFVASGLEYFMGNIPVQEMFLLKKN